MKETKAASEEEMEDEQEDMNDQPPMTIMPLNQEIQEDDAEPDEAVEQQLLREANLSVDEIEERSIQYNEY